MHFKAQTYDPVKGLQHTSFEAVDLQEAESFLKSQGLSIVSIEQDNSIKHKAVKFNLLLWVSELLTLVEAGISLPEALKCIGAKENTFIGKLSLKLLKSLNEGKSLSDAMVLQDSLFPPLLIAMVKSSEVTGNLANALRRFRAYSENMEGLRTKIVSAAVYPLILLLIGGIVVLFLLGYVVPKFSGAYEYVGSDLPYLSKMLIALGGQINKYPIQFYSFGGTCLAGIAWFFISGSFMRVLPSVLYSFEAIRTRLITYELARFYRTVGLLIEGGIPVKKALAMSSGLFQIPELKSGLEKAIESVSEGKSLTRNASVGIPG